jgi:hypothetical protein
VEELQPVESTRRSRIRWASLFLLSAVYTFALVIPFAPQIPRNCDSETSWMLVMHAGWKAQPQFGSDRIFTYGPYGFCVPPIYYPPTYPIVLAIRAAVAGILLWSIWSIVPAIRRVSDNPIAAALWIFPFIGAVTSGDDVLFPMCGVLLLAVYFYVDDMRLTAKSVLLLAVLALAGLAKFSWLTINTTLVVLLTADQLLGRRRWNFWIPGLYLAFLATLWLAAGQRAASFIDYLRTGAELAGGYTQGMMLLTSELTDVEFALAAMLLWALIADVNWRLHRGRGAIHSAALALILFAAFKQSFVRHDAPHVLVGPFLLFSMAMVYVVVIWPNLTKSSHRSFWVAAVGLALMNMSATVAHYSDYGLFGYYARTIQFASQSVREAFHLARGDGDLRGRYASALAEVRAAQRLPPITGSTDVYSNAQVVAVAYGLDYRPRPIFQSYAAYTPALVGINRAYLQSDRGPANILFDVQTIDLRLPALDDGLSWPELLTRYDVVGMYDTMAVLKRAAVPRRYTLTPLPAPTGRLSESIAVPGSSDDLVWAEIDVKLSPRGRLAALLYRPPGLLIQVRTAGGIETYRFIAPIARAGFLLSPLVRTRGEFVSLASDRWREDLKSRTVKSISILPFGYWGERDAAAFFEPEFRIRLSRLKFDGEDLSRIPGWNKRLGSMWRGRN